MKHIAFILPLLFFGFASSGCTPEPTTITFEGDPVVTLHSLDKVQVHQAVVRDADGEPILPAPTLTWTIAPATVATLERDRIVPVGNGQATVEAQRGGVSGTYTVVVALPDKVVIGGYDPAVPWIVGESRALTAVVKAGETALPDTAVTWAASNPNIVALGEGGEAKALLAGVTTLTATSGALVATVDVTVVDAPPQ